LTEIELEYFKQINKSIITIDYKEARDFLFIVQLLDLPKEKVNEAYKKWCKDYREINKDLDIFENEV